MALTYGWDPWKELTDFFWGRPATIQEEQRRVAKVAIEIASGLLLHLDYREQRIQQGPLAVFLRLRRERTCQMDLSPKSKDLPLIEGLLQCLGDKMLTGKIPSLGIYDHFKGGVYLVQGVSKWASGENERVVEYISLPKAQKFTRFASQWCEVVKWPDGFFRSRFVFRGHPNKEPLEPKFRVRV